MATPSQTFQLDPAVFNQTLYSQLHELWFRGQSEASGAPNLALMKRWFAVGLSPEEKDALDGECRLIAGTALDTISPSKLVLPPFESYADDLEHADSMAAPLLNEVKRAQQIDEKTGAETFLSMVLLLDQMPRNIWRQQNDLRLVYDHYDRLAWTLVRSTLATDPDLMETPATRSRTYWMWFLLPLVHSEHLPSHELAQHLVERWRERSNESSDGAAAEFAQNYKKSQESHIKAIQRFGRYPHRNICLGRENTKEEEEYLKTADTFGVKQTATPPVKDEL